MKKFFKHMGWKIFLVNAVTFVGYVSLAVVMSPSLLSEEVRIRAVTAAYLIGLGGLGLMSFYSQWRFYRLISR